MSMKKEYYTTFWDIVVDWRHYDSLSNTNELSKQRLVYLTRNLGDLLEAANKREVDIFKGYYGILRKDENSSVREFSRTHLEKGLKKFNKLVKFKKIICADDISR